MVGPEPLVSIVIPVWNTGKSACELLGVLIEQKYKNLEIIVIDDGSTDDSLSILKKFAKSDRRIEIIHQDNAGVSAARNRGLKQAQGKYVLFVDSDDQIEASYVEKMVEAMEKNPNVILAVAGKVYNKLIEHEMKSVFTAPRRARKLNERMSDYMVYLMILDGRMYSVTNKIFRVETIRKNRLRFEQGRNFAEDTKFVIDYLRAIEEGEIVFILEPLSIYNYGTETSTVKNSAKIWKNWERSYQDLEEWARRENGGKLAIRTRALLGLVRLRWHVSHYKAKKRAKAVRSA